VNNKTKHQSADDVPLISLGGFKRVIKKVLSVSKSESDRQLAAFQASNLKKREAKKHR
jgi:hypothetical protein